jgi:UDP-2,4-diacetamido-2,4,6-trideoxy-beta-L-altropyranose hydrolase
MPGTDQTLLVRADANRTIGTGHVMRCLALAEAWQTAGGRVVFVSVEMTRALQERLQGRGHRFVGLAAVPGSAEDAAQVGALARSHSVKWVVADGNGFGSVWQCGIKQAGLRILQFDDYGQLSPYCSDVIVNPNLDAVPEFYTRRAPYTRLLLGSRYVQLRSEFLAWRGWVRPQQAAHRQVLITFGGSDPDNLTADAMGAVAGLPGMTATVVVGAANPRQDELRALAGTWAGRMRCVQDVADMPSLMAAVDLAIICAGGTLWECLYMQLPTLSFVRDAVQERVVRSLASRGLVWCLGDAAGASSQRIRAAIEEVARAAVPREAARVACRGIVDGEGSARVLALLKD